jgi:hypothetical protein
MAGKHGVMNFSALNKALFASMRAEAKPRRNAPLRAAVASASAARQRTPAASASVARVPVYRRSPSWHGKVRSYFEKARARKTAGARFKSNLAKARPALKEKVRQSRRGMNINALIKQANAAAKAFNIESSNSVERRIKRAEFFRTRNAVLEELGRRAGERNSRVGEILKNINKNKNKIVSAMNAANKENRYISWRNAVALNQGGKRKNIGKRYKGPTPSPPHPSPPRHAGRRTPEWARGIGASNIANWVIRHGGKV